jgi:hypothetical protein
LQPNLAHAARVLWLRVPEPARRKPKPRKTWKTLDLGRELELLTGYFDGSTQWSAGEKFTVCSPITDQGVVLRDPAGKEAPWSADWKPIFKKVRKKPVRKKKSEV